MASVSALESVRFAVITPATVRLLEALVLVAAGTNDVDDVIITSGTDGVHSGLTDPHHRGSAIDVRSHNFPSSSSKTAFLKSMERALGERFFLYLEDPGGPNEHFHLQVRRGVEYPPPPVNPLAPRKA